MKKLSLSLAAALLAAVAFCDPVADVKAGADLAVRCSGGTFTVSAFGSNSTAPLIPSATVTTLAHIPKAANGLVASLATAGVFTHLGIATTLTFTGATDSVTGGINWTVTDPTAIGTTISVPYGGSNYSVTVTGVSGHVYSVASALALPVLDPFDHNYRASQISPDASQTSAVTITGTYAGVIPVSVTINPDIAGIGGVGGTEFPLNLTVTSGSNTNAINLVSGQTYTGTVTLEVPAVQNTAVSISGLLFAGVTPTTVLATKSSATFTFTADSVGSTVPAWLTATANGHSFTKPLNVLPLLASLTIVTSPVLSGAPVTFSVNLNAKAPLGGVVVKLHSEDPNLVFPASVTVPQNATSVEFQATPAVVATGTSTTAVTSSYVDAIYSSTIVRTLITLH